MKKSPPQKKSAEAETAREKKAVSCKKSTKKVPFKVTAPKKQRPPQTSTSLSENIPPMISLEDYTDQESLTSFEKATMSGKIRPRKKGTRKKSRRLKVTHNRPFYDPDEVDFELEDQEFLDEELISLEEFDSLLNKTKGNSKEEEEEIAPIDHHKGETSRNDLPHSVGSGTRKKVQRRRQIDPTTCERDYTTDEVEFMRALDEYKRNSGRMFPTCSEILEVLLGLGYAKTAPPPQEQTVSIDSASTQTLTLTVDNFTTEVFPTVTAVGSEYHQEYLPFFLNDSLSVLEMSTLPEGFSV